MMRCCRPVDVKVGVLALQGNVSEHIDAFVLALEHLGRGRSSDVVAIRHPSDLEGCHALALPGGESTTISRLINKNHLYEPIRDFSGGIFATCAGMVLIATHVDDDRIDTLNIIDITVDRNAFGRQRESFEIDLPINILDGGSFHAIFIRAPVATRAGAEVTILSRLDQGIVAVEQGKHMALSFHPELGGDTRLHERFLKNIGI
jgi:5'-phosphate synthase pdxT subunit